MAGFLRGRISSPKLTLNVLKTLRRLIYLITIAEFIDGTFNVQTLLECNHDRVIAAGQSLFQTLSLIIGVRDPADNPTPPIGTTD